MTVTGWPALAWQSVAWQPVEGLLDHSRRAEDRRRATDTLIGSALGYRGSCVHITGHGPAASVVHALGRLIGSLGPDRGLSYSPGVRDRVAVISHALIRPLGGHASSTTT